MELCGLAFNPFTDDMKINNKFFDKFVYKCSIIIILNRILKYNT